MIDDLPPTLNTNQIRFTGDGDFRVQSLYYTYRIDTLNKDELVVDFSAEYITEQIQERSEKVNELNGRIAIYQKEKSLLESNSQFRNEFNSVDVEVLSSAASFLRNKYLEIHDIILDLTKERQGLEQEINELNLERNKQNIPVIEKFLELNILVVTDQPESADFKVVYQTNQAGWTPFYETRVNSIEEPVVLNYQAKVYQRTGEDWEEVELTLSSGKPQQSKQKPELSTWLIGQNATQTYNNYNNTQNQNQNQYSNNQNAWLSSQPYNANIREVNGQILDAQTSEPLPFVTIVAGGSNVGTISDIDGRYRIAIPNGVNQLEYASIGYKTMLFNVAQPTMNVYMETDYTELDAVMISSDVSTKEMMISPSYTTVAGVQSNGGGVFKRKKKYKYEEPPIDYVSMRASYTPTQVKFTAEVPYTIPSDGQEYLVQLDEIDVPAKYIYSCAPKLDERAYLTARITDWEFLDLLPGEANVYFEGGFVGQTRIDPSFADDTLNLSLGIDKSIRVYRDRIKSGYKKQILSGSKKESREWMITIRNNKTTDIEIIIEDQIPVSQREDVIVKLTESSGADLKAENGRLQWNLIVKAQKVEEKKFKYSVESPKEIYLPID